MEAEILSILRYSLTLSKYLFNSSTYRIIKLKWIGKDKTEKIKAVKSGRVTKNKLKWS